MHTYAMPCFRRGCPWVFVVRCHCSHPENFREVQGALALAWRVDSSLISNFSWWISRYLYTWTQLVEFQLGGNSLLQAMMSNGVGTPSARVVQRSPSPYIPIRYFPPTYAKPEHWTQQNCFYSVTPTALGICQAYSVPDGSNLKDGKCSASGA